MQSENIINILTSVFKQYEYIDTKFIVDDTDYIESDIIAITIKIMDGTLIFSNTDMEYGDNKFDLISYSSLYNLSIDEYQTYINLLIISDHISKDIKQNVSKSLVIIEPDHKKYKSLRFFDEYDIKENSIFADNQEYQIYKQIKRNRFGNKYKTSNYCLDSNNIMYYYFFINKDLRLV